MVYKEQSSDGYAIKCWFSDCNETKTKYCLDKWLCDSKKNYWKRIKGFLGVTR